eukprot:g19033.t1
MVTAKDAFTGPEADKWIEADTLERTQLEALKCWRPVEDGELQPDDEVIPAVVIYSKKRCGRFKARLVALGNRQKQVLSSEIYSPTISAAANRFLLIEAAARGHHLRQFDISNAFIKFKAALTDERVFLRLPSHWSSSRKGDLVRLLKSLYGLKIAPRKWFDEYKKGLEADGWVMCEREPGLFRKKIGDGELLSAVYVDDTLLTGADPVTLDREMHKILSLFPGKVIPPEMEESTEVRDVLGVTVRYDREKRSVRFSMEQAIDRLLVKFRMQDAKARVSPCVPEDLAQGAKNEIFPLRSLVGGLQYIGTQCRPDIVFAVQRVARQQSEPTDAAVRAAKRVLAYLKGTKSVGLEYSPEIEAKFRETFSKVAADAGKELPDTVAFSDADFAGCTVTLRSTSGSILYHRGTPVAWSSKRQSVKALSTCEAEYVATYDTVRMSLAQGFLDWFMVDRSLPLTFVDSQSALCLSKTSLVTKRSKRINLRFHMVRDHAKDLCWVPTDLNRADPLTKKVPTHLYLKMFHPAAPDANGDEVDDGSDDEDLAPEAGKVVRAFYFNVDHGFGPR